jgi:hypothetical protein
MAQLCAFSPDSQTPSPHRGTGRQSSGQICGVSNGSHTPLPQVRPQSVQHVCADSFGEQTESPQTAQST